MYDFSLYDEPLLRKSLKLCLTFTWNEIILDVYEPELNFDWLFLARTFTILNSM
jgi:hypothetical protein